VAETIVTQLIDEQIDALNAAIDSGVEEFNEAVSKSKIPAVFIDSDD
jgi:hypothetical protein